MLLSLSTQAFEKKALWIVCHLPCKLCTCEIPIPYMGICLTDDDMAYLFSWSDEYRDVASGTAGISRLLDTATLCTPDDRHLVIETILTHGSDQFALGLSLRVLG